MTEIAMMSVSSGGSRSMVRKLARRTMENLIPRRMMMRKVMKNVIATMIEGTHFSLTAGQGHYNG